MKISNAKILRLARQNKAAGVVASCWLVEMVGWGRGRMERGGWLAGARQRVCARELCAPASAASQGAGGNRFWAR